MRVGSGARIRPDERATGSEIAVRTRALMLPRAKNVNANRAAFSKPRISLHIRPIRETVAKLTAQTAHTGRPIGRDGGWLRFFSPFRSSPENPGGRRAPSDQNSRIGRVGRRGPNPADPCAQNSRICLRIFPIACSWSWRIRSRDRLYLSPISFSVSSSSLSRPKRQRMMRDSIGVSVPSRR
jgi:hypothetical protein